MDFSAQLDALQANLDKAKAAVQGAATESREEIRQRIEQAEVDVDQAVKETEQHADAAADSARSKWAQMKSDAAAKMDDIKQRMDRRGAQIDADLAASDAA